MASSPDPKQSLDHVLTPRAREALRHLEIFARRTVQGMLHGVHKSRRKGVSTEFDHHTLYQPGDPIKHVDWKVSARHDRYYVKRYLEDTALTVRIFLDCSGSMLRETDGAKKFLQSSRLAACLAYLIMSQRDTAGLVLTSSERTEWLRPGSTEAHMVRMLQALVSRGPAESDGLAASLKAFLDRGESKGLTAVVSDCMFDPVPVQQQLARLAAQGHEILVFQLRDPVEEEFPFNRWVRFQSLEDAAVRHRVDTVPLKRIYREEYAALMDEWRAWARKHDIHFVTFRTDEPVETALSEYILHRSGAEGA